MITQHIEKPQKILAVSPWFLEAGKGATFSTPPEEEFKPRPYTAKKQETYTYIAILGGKKSRIFFSV